MANIEEIWKTIEGYPNYEISNLGRVKRLAHLASRKRVRPHGSDFPLFFGERILNTRKNIGYYIVSLRDNGNRKTFKVHRLIALAFIPNPENKPFINHINSIPSDNRIENLEWCTPAENANHMVKSGRSLCGDKNPNAKLTPIAIKVIREAVREGYSFSSIGKYFKIAPINIKRISLGLNWKNIPI